MSIDADLSACGTTRSPDRTRASRDIFVERLQIGLLIQCETLSKSCELCTLSSAECLRWPAIFALIRCVSSHSHFHPGTFELDSRIPSAVQRALASSDPVVLRGNGGLGPARLARAIHDGSARRRGPFEYLACSNMPDLLVASELVGHREGSFPGAVRDKRGALAWRAHEGTLAIGDVAAIGPQSRQAVADLIRRGEVVPVGARESAGKVDVRVILMTDGPLDPSVLDALGAFIEIHVPATTDRDRPVSSSPNRMLKANDL